MLLSLRMYATMQASKHVIMVAYRLLSQATPKSLLVSLIVFILSKLKGSMPYMSYMYICNKQY